MKRRHISLALKLNILLTALILTISSVLLVVSNSAFQQTVIDPYTGKLADVKIDVKDLPAYLSGFSKVIESEAFQQMRSAPDFNADLIIDWLNQHPPAVMLTDAESASKHQTLMVDYFAFMMAMSPIRDRYDLNRMIVEVRSGQRIYEIGEEEKGGTYWDTNDFGRRGPMSDLQPDQYSTPILVNRAGRKELTRCITVDAEDTVGCIWVIYDMTEIIHQHHAYMLRSALYVFLQLIIACVISMFLMRRIVTKPLKQLTDAAAGFTAGDNGFTKEDVIRLNIRSQDEIGDLYRQIQEMQLRIVDDTQHLTHMTAEKERIGTELSMAARIQSSMLPSVFPPYPNRPEFDIYASMDPAKEVGGDFYDFFLIDNDHLGLVIADVSGKGVPAALFMMISKVIVQSCAMLGQSAGEILTKTNEALCSNNKSEMFVTVWVGILEISTGILTAANAGHEYPAIRHGDAFELLKDRHGIVIGVMDGYAYQEYTIRLERGDQLFVYTDGVPEATNPRNELFGTDRMIDALNASPGSTPQEILSSVRQAVDRFTDTAEQFDDMTMLCLQYNGSPAQRADGDTKAAR